MTSIRRAMILVALLAAALPFGWIRCRADSVSSLLPADRNASANWKMAGLLSVGGIPNRTTVCATVNPLGGVNDDTANIQNAINSCPAGQVVSLSGGTFTIGEGNYVLLNQSITLRGAGPGNTILQRTNGAHLQPGAATGSSISPIILVSSQRVRTASAVPGPQRKAVLLANH
jgi:hypothetical protein